jgi:predicted nucleic acid-binding protein
VTVVVDASVVVAGLVDGGDAGEWSADLLRGHPLAAPHLLHAEVANVLRRASIGGDLGADVAALAHADLLRLRVALFPYEPFGDRVWELRSTMTTYDAWYVAVAERLGVGLATLDHRLARSAGARCAFLTPPA